MEFFFATVTFSKEVFSETAVHFCDLVGDQIVENWNVEDGTLVTAISVDPTTSPAIDQVVLDFAFSEDVTDFSVDRLVQRLDRTLTEWKMGDAKVVRRSERQAVRIGFRENQVGALRAALAFVPEGGSIGFIYSHSAEIAVDIRNEGEVRFRLRIDSGGELWDDVGKVYLTGPLAGATEPVPVEAL